MKTVLIASLLLALGTGNAAADAAKGKKLHDANCMKCHDTGVYTRSDHFVTSRDALKKQITRCKMNVGAQWSDADITDVVQYLDQTFYKFR